MTLNVYQFSKEIVDGDCNIWIKGDSDTGKTTFLKFLFDRDEKHLYKWLVGGSEPSKSEVYYKQIVKDILETTYIGNATMTIYVDEILNCHVKELMKLEEILHFPIRYIIVSHHLPPNDVKESFTIINMNDILSIQLLLEKICMMSKFKIPVNENFSISDYFFIIEHIEQINSPDELMKLYEENMLTKKQRIETKMSVEHNIWIFQSSEYERINVLRIKEV